MTRATRGLVALAALLLAVLGASGAWLWWNYRPDGKEWIRVVHQVAAAVLLALAVVLVALAILRRARTGASGIVAAIAVMLSTGGAYVVGRLLPWDQLALWAVVTRKEFPLGVAATFDDRVRYILLRGREVAASTYQGWAYAHLGLSLLVLVALVMVWLRARDRAVSRGSPSRQPSQPPVGRGTEQPPEPTG